MKKIIKKISSKKTPWECWNGKLAIVHQEVGTLGAQVCVQILNSNTKVVLPKELLI